MPAPKPRCEAEAVSRSTPSPTGLVCRSRSPSRRADTADPQPPRSRRRPDKPPRRRRLRLPSPAAVAPRAGHHAPDRPSGDRTSQRLGRHRWGDRLDEPVAQWARDAKSVLGIKAMHPHRHGPRRHLHRHRRGPLPPQRLRRQHHPRDPPGVHRGLQGARECPRGRRAHSLRTQDDAPRRGRARQHGPPARARVSSRRASSSSG